jgi:hypothetical protein
MFGFLSEESLETKAGTRQWNMEGLSKMWCVQCMIVGTVLQFWTRNINRSSALNRGSHHKEPRAAACPSHTSRSNITPPKQQTETRPRSELSHAPKPSMPARVKVIHGNKCVIFLLPRVVLSRPMAVPCTQICLPAQPHSKSLCLKSGGTRITL